MQASEPTVSRVDGDVVVRREKSAASVPVRESVPLNGGAVGAMLAVIASTAVPGEAPGLNDPPVSETPAITWPDDVTDDRTDGGPTTGWALAPSEISSATRKARSRMVSSGCAGR